MDATNRIIAIATQLFLKEGVKRVTMDDLATALGMSKRTIYESFSNKDEIIKVCIKGIIEQQNELNLKIAKQSKTAVHILLSLLDIGLENMKSSSPQFASDIRKYYPEIWRSTLEANRKQKLDQTVKLIERGVGEGVFRDDINIVIISKLLQETMKILFDYDIFPPHIFSPTETFSNTIICFARGIASKKGQEIIMQYESKKIKQNN